MKDATNSEPSTNEIRETILKPGKARLKWFIIILLLIAGVAVFVWKSGDDGGPVYQTEEVTLGDITSEASATGTLSPTRVVSIGSEISGRIESVSVEENDIVTKGQILAVFDKTTLQSKLATARARLSASNASVRGAKAIYDDAVFERKRTEKLVARGVVPRAELDALRTKEIRAKADGDRSRADVAQQRAAFVEAESQLEKAAILSPIDGVILTRSVEPGQTVAASLQAPELFVVAQDLTKMTLEIWIDEADVGLVKTQQNVIFTVAAWPDKEFSAVVKKINLSPTSTGNVVTYSATLAVDNRQRLLRPGMTAAATVVTDVRANVVRVSNAALRFAPVVKDKSGFKLGPPTGAGDKKEVVKSVGDRASVYLLKDGAPQQVIVTRGRSDGRYVEISKGNLKAGDVIITNLKTGATK